LYLFDYKDLAITFKDFQIRCRYDDYTKDPPKQHFMYELSNFVNFILEGRLASLYETLYNKDILFTTNKYDGVFEALRQVLENSIPIHLIVKYLNTTLRYSHTIKHTEKPGAVNLVIYSKRSLIIDQIRCYSICKHLFKKTENPLFDPKIIQLCREIDSGVHDELLPYISLEYDKLARELYRTVTIHHRFGKAKYTIGFEDYIKLTRSLQDIYTNKDENILERFSYLLWNLYRFEATKSNSRIKKLRENLYVNHETDPTKQN
jgi:hypothetical protein